MFILKVVQTASLSFAAVSIYRLFTSEPGFEARFALSVTVGSLLFLTLATGFIAVVEAIEKLSAAKQESQVEADDVLEATQ